MVPKFNVSFFFSFRKFGIKKSNDRKKQKKKTTNEITFVLTAWGPTSQALIPIGNDFSHTKEAGHLAREIGPLAINMLFCLSVWFSFFLSSILAWMNSFFIQRFMSEFVAFITLYVYIHGAAFSRPSWLFDCVYVCTGSVKDRKYKWSICEYLMKIDS